MADDNGPAGGIALADPVRERAALARVHLGHTWLGAL
jgi:hypothetical protein